MAETDGRNDAEDVDIARKAESLGNYTLLLMLRSILATSTKN